MKRIYLCLMAVFALVMHARVLAWADEDGEQILMETLCEVQVYEEKDESSNIKTVLEENTPVICMAVYEDGWYKIAYQDIEGYVLQGKLKNYGEQKSLDAEFDGIAEENDMQAETINMLQKQEKSERLWGGIMVLLIGAMVIGMFASGIRALRSSHKNKGESAENEREIR